MNHAAVPRWEWRAFASSFEWLDPLMPPEYVMAHEIYVLSDTPTVTAKIRNGVIQIKSLEDVRDGLELWRPSFIASFPLCHRDVRQVCTAIGARTPEILFLPCYSVEDFIADIACCTPGVRVVGVNKARRHVSVEGCLVGRASVSAAGHLTQTAVVESPDDAAVRRLVARLRLDQFHNVNYAAYLKGVLTANPMEPIHESHSCAVRND